MALVFQYGSNASRGRLNGPRRLNGHASVQGPAETVDDYDICFDVYSNTNRCAASDLVDVSGRKAWGVLYEIPDEFIRGERSDGQKTLAQIEGSRYEEKDITVRRPNGEVAQAMTFLVRSAERQSGLTTSVWYVSWIVYGLREQGVREPYIAHVIDVALATNEQAGDPEKQNELIRNL
jgi:cation transport regulator ChaC